MEYLIQGLELFGGSHFLEIRGTTVVADDLRRLKLSLVASVRNRRSYDQQSNTKSHGLCNLVPVRYGY
jgi:hypothetical protein